MDLDNRRECASPGKRRARSCLISYSEIGGWVGNSPESVRSMLLFVASQSHDGWLFHPP